MKKIITALFICFAIANLANAQPGQDDQIQKGKTYYDSAHTLVKEIYQYKEHHRIVYNPATGDMELSDTPTLIKHGIYTLYYKQDKPEDELKIQAEGKYVDDKKHGEWHYYNTKGIIIKTEKWDNGKLVSTQ